MKSAAGWMGLVAAGWLAAGAQAAAPQIRATATLDGVTWSYSLGENGAIVTGADPAKGALSVPSTLGGQTVVEIGYAAFASCDELTSVSLPSGVRNIANLAFQYCSLLESVSIPAGVTNIGTMAFQYGDSLSTLALPQSVESIGTNALYHCDGLAKLYVPLAWWGSTKTTTAGVDGSCTVVYGEPGKETVVFDANGGECGTASRAYPLGEPYGWLPDASRLYYAFGGWGTAANGGTIIAATDSASVEGRRVLYAQWTPAAQTVTFDANGGTCATATAPFAFGATYSPLPEATRPNYAFEGWWTSAVGGTNVTEESAVTTNATRTLYAHWTLVEQTVTFDAQGGTCDTTNRNYVIGGKYSPLPKPTREGYVFDGWFTSYSGGDRISAASTVTEAERRTLYAHWTLVEQLVTFDANGGTCSTSSQAYAIGGTYGWLPEATRDGCAFIGWQTPEGGEVLETSVVSERRFQTLQARWLHCSLANGEACATRMIPTNAIGDIAIPPEFMGHPITGIETNAFSGCNGLTSVTIPGNVTSIGGNTFSGCSGLTNVTILGNVTNDWSWGGYDRPFSGCTNLATAVLGSKMTKIGDYMFSACSRLMSVTIPDSVTNIGSHAFYGCNALTNVTIPDGVMSIGGSAFSGCSGMTSVMIPDSVTNIGSHAFYGCNALTNVTIPDGVMSIGSYAFYDCIGLTSLPIPDRVTDIGSYAFCNCSGLANVVIGNGVTNIGERAFSGCSALISVTIPNSLTSIGSGAFSGCSGLANVTIPDSVTSLGSIAFAGCSGLTNVVIGNGVASIGYNAFHGCSGLASVKIPDGVASIGSSAFAGCSGLASVTIPDSMATIADSAFADCHATLYDTTRIQGVVLVDGWAVGWTNALPAILELTGVRGIAVSAFSDCGGLTSVTIPGSVTSIGDRAFSSCTGLASVTIGNGLTSIGYQAFYDCNCLASVVIGNGVTNIGGHAFSGCSGLTNVTIPDSVRSIREYAFSGCRALTSMTIPDSVRDIGGSVFSNCTGLASVTIGNGVTNIGWEAFYECICLTNVTIGKSVTHIGSYAFYDCIGLTSLPIPDSVTDIGSYAFYNCSGLTNAVIGNGVMSIGGGSFWGCSGLTDVTIPDSVRDIGGRAFSGCSGLTSVAIGNGVTNIGGSAFSGCSALESLTISYGARSIGDYAFSSSSALASLTIPDSVRSIGKYAFSGCSGLTTLYAPEPWTDYWPEDGAVFWSKYAGVRSDCKIIYYTPPKTGTGVPYSWLAGYGLGDGTAEGYEAAANAKAANGMAVWECYVAGLDPTDQDAEFKAELWVEEDGQVRVGPVGGAKAGRKYRVMGRTELGDDEGWTDVTGQEERWVEDGWRFFKVGVSLAE